MYSYFTPKQLISIFISSLPMGKLKFKEIYSTTLVLLSVTWCNERDWNMQIKFSDLFHSAHNF